MYDSYSKNPYGIIMMCVYLNVFKSLALHVMVNAIKFINAIHKYSFCIQFIFISISGIY